MSKRFVIEGTWSGYVSRQRQVCHREVRDYGREKWESISAIQFNDGTYLEVKVRDCLPRERVKAIKGYSKMLSDAYYSGLGGVISVSDLK